MGGGGARRVAAGVTAAGNLLAGIVNRQGIGLSAGAGTFLRRSPVLAPVAFACQGAVNGPGSKAVNVSPWGDRLGTGVRP
jgi:hypothetical protein